MRSVLISASKLAFRSASERAVSSGFSWNWTHRARRAFVILLAILGLVDCGSGRSNGLFSGPGANAGGAAGTTGRPAAGSGDGGDSSAPLTCSSGVACGAECIDTQSDPSHCGDCATKCPLAAACSAGQCQCPSGQQVCGADCAKLATDAAHCGSCDRACPLAASCSAGQCACPENTELCGGVCADTSSDPAHCGACGRACPKGGICTEGACMCPPAQATLCDNECADLQSSFADCGACGTSCVNNQICDDGACTCAAGQADCNLSDSQPGCADLSNDPAHCGSCATSCVNNQICDGGACTCAAGQADCNLSDSQPGCADLTSTAAHCGSCETQCPGNEPCINSKCGCPTGQTLCGDSCVDLSSDPLNCSACGKQCSGKFCTAGQCLKSPCDLLCSDPEQVSLGVDGFRIDPVGSAAGCLEVDGYAPTATNARIVCWNFDSNRSLSVNGQPVPCQTDTGFALSASRAGGYCVQVGAGGTTSAGLLLPTH